MEQQNSQNVTNTGTGTTTFCLVNVITANVRKMGERRDK